MHIMVVRVYAHLPGTREALNWSIAPSLGVHVTGRFLDNHLGECAQALASEALRQRAVVQERTSWRQAVSEVLTAAAAADGMPAAPLHVLAAWLSVLPWLADSRWRRLRTGAAAVHSTAADVDIASHHPHNLHVCRAAAFWRQPIAKKLELGQSEAMVQRMQ